MATETAHGGAERLGFLLVPGFQMLDFFLAVEPLRIANRAAGRRLFEWRTYSIDGAQVEAGNGMTIAPDGAAAEATACSLVFVCAGFEPERQAAAALAPALRRLARHGVTLGGIDTGAVLLARAGLLEAHRATLHWEALASFRDRFPDVEATDELYEIDRNRITCAGGIATVDLMLALMGLWQGRDLALSVAELMVHGRLRVPSQQQRLAVHDRLRLLDPRLAAVVREMESHLEEPLGPAALAARAGLSVRQVQRLFHRHLGSGPQRYYSKLRLLEARRLVLQTSQPMLAIALACGFESAAAFSRAYRRHFGRAPRDDRRMYHGEDLRRLLPGHESIAPIGFRGSDGVPRRCGNSGLGL